VSHSILLQKTRSILVWVVLSLSIIALTAELLPEVKAKMIVIPTLVLMIILSIIEIRQRWTVKSQ
jgi:cell shape-determining protein MreD